MDIFESIVDDIKNVFKSGKSDKSNDENNKDGSKTVEEGATEALHNTVSGAHPIVAPAAQTSQTPAEQTATATGAQPTTTSDTHTKPLEPGEEFDGEEADAWASSAGQIWTDQQNINFFQKNQDGGTAGGLCPGLQITSLDSTSATADQAVFQKYWATTPDGKGADQLYSQLSALQQQGDKHPNASFKLTDSRHGEKVYKNGDGSQMTIQKGRVEHKEGGADTTVTKDGVHVTDHGTKIDDTKKEITYRGPNGVMYHMTKSGDGSYSDPHGDTLTWDKQHGTLELKVHDGPTFETDGRHWREKVGHGKHSFYTERGGDPEKLPSKGETVQGNGFIKVMSKDGHAYAVVGDNGERVINILGPDGKVAQQIFTRGDSNEMIIKQPGKNDIELTQQDGKWVAQEIGPDGQKHDISLSQVKIDGHTVGEHDSAVKVTGDMKVTASGQVSSQSDTGGTITSQGTGSKVGSGDPNDGGSVEVNGSTSKTTTTDNNTRTTTEQDPDGDFHAWQQHRDRHGHWGHREQVFHMSPGGDVHMEGPQGSQGVDFHFAQAPGGGLVFQKANMWNGDTVTANGTIDRANGDVINADDSVNFADGTRVDSNGNVTQNGNYLGTAGGGAWVAQEGSAVGAAEAAVASADSVAGQISSMVSSGHVDAGALASLLSLYSSLGALKGELLTHGGANLETAAALGNVDGAQAEVGGSIAAAEVAMFQKSTAESLTAAGASPEILAALQKADAGTDVSSIMTQLKQEGVLDNPRVPQAQQQAT